MYLDFYGLKEAPFSITPDPRFVLLSERHRDALAHLLFGIGQGGSGGFVQLTGEVGTGKTTLSRLLLEQLPENTRVALVLNPRLSPLELVESICEELKIDVAAVRGSLKGLVDALNHFLLDAYAAGQRVVVIIDEAQNLSAEALEQVRLLTNLETPTQKLLQIILLGQPELREQLDAPHLRQLAQRITARYHLTPLDEAETEAYARHRLAVAGAPRFPFTRLGVRALHRRSGGVPRLINIIAERALLAGYVSNQLQIGERLVDHAADEVFGRKRERRRVAAVVVVLAALVAGALWAWRTPEPEAVATAGVETAAPALPASAPLDAPALAAALAALPPDADLAAWSRLLALWGVDAQRVDPAAAARCPEQIVRGLYCLRLDGNLAKLERFDRPVIVRLVSGERARLGVLTRLDANAVTLDFGVGGDSAAGLSEPRGRSFDQLSEPRGHSFDGPSEPRGRSFDQLPEPRGHSFDGPSEPRGRSFDQLPEPRDRAIRVARADFERNWLGEYFAVWRAPGFLPETIRRGEIGAPVAWLRQQLAAFGPAGPAQEGPPQYDAALEARVRAVQTTFGLLPDGIVGPETKFALTTRDAAGPVLKPAD